MSSPTVASWLGSGRRRLAGSSTDRPGRSSRIRRRFPRDLPLPLGLVEVADELVDGPRPIQGDGLPGARSRRAQLGPRGVRGRDPGCDEPEWAQEEIELMNHSGGGRWVSDPMFVAVEPTVPLPGVIRNVEAWGE